LTFNYPGQTYTANQANTPGLSALNAGYENDTLLASSATTTLVVQQDPIQAPITSYPLPTAYWTRPIYGENTDWYTISSNWLGIGSPNYGGWMNSGQDALSGPNTFMQVNPGDAIGSQTSHIMWTKPMQSGGVVGGENFDVKAQTFFDGSAYIIRYNNPIIMDGKIFYTEAVSFSNTGYRGSTSGPTDCVDLRTGQLIWSRTDVPNLSFGLLMDVQTANEHGVCQPILIAASSWSPSASTTWAGFDGDTGTPLFNVTNIPGYTNALLGNPAAVWRTGSGRAMGPDGEYLDYIFANAGNTTKPDWRLGQWNSTKLFLPGSSLAPTLNQVKWPLYLGNLTIDGGISTGTNTRYDWNISVPWMNAMINTSPIIVSAKYNDGILMQNGTMPCNGENNLYNWISSAPYTYFFVNLNPAKGAIGSILWTRNIDSPANNYTVVQGPVDWDNRVIMQDYKEAAQWAAYSLNDGSFLWKADPQTAFDYYGSTSEGTLPGAVAYGHLYSSAYGGILYCYDDTTGKVLWTYGNGGSGNTTDSGLAWPYGHIPTQINAIGNGIVYLITSEHTWTTPIYKGGLARAINATDGTEIWTISGVTMEFGMMSYAVADGFSTWFNGYDNQIYVVGKGPSSTTVDAPKASIELGRSLVISGSVIDIASGTKQNQQAADFPNGVPCVSDASMKDWMGYVYQQRPVPTSATGVTVTLSVLDSNNNFRTISTTTTDLSGAYSYQWKPDIPGKYTVYASFAGTNSYWPSSAETSFAVDQAAPTTATQAPIVNATSNDPTYFLGSTIAIIIAIAIVGVLILRKRV
jgi:outer membrane protein assembly factor BamB